MDDTKRNILLTGKPGCGKTTVIDSFLHILDLPAAGFITREVRDENKRRTGFLIETLDGKKGVLAGTGITSRYRVGRYGVDLENLDNIGVPSIDHGSDNHIIVIDEIGKMECFSRLFCKAVTSALDSGKVVIGTVSLGGHPFIREIRQRQDVSLVEVNLKNRDRLPADLAERVKGLLNLEYLN